MSIPLDLQVRALRRDQLVLKKDDQAVHEACLQPFEGNPEGCPNFGKTWGCPPHAPDVAAFKDFLDEYPHYYLVYLELEVKDDQGNQLISDKDTRETYNRMNDLLNAFIDQVKEKWEEDVFVFHGQGCRYCSTRGKGKCTCPDEECRFPRKKAYSLSVVLEIIDTMNRAGMEASLDLSSALWRVGVVASKTPIDLEGLAASFSG